MGTSALCANPGSDGYRVQAIYGYVGTNNLTSRLESIKQYAVNVDLAFNNSAAETGGTRHVRFVTDSSCNLSVIPIQFASNTIASTSAQIDSAFNNTIAKLQDLGYDNNDRKYLVWFDKNDATCGIGTYDGDESSSQNNLSNRTTGYGRVDVSCWDYGEAHELMHTLGAVNPNAPHSTDRRGGGGHCTDDYDIMCYADANGVTIDHICPSSHEKLFDCNHDDYFSTNPAAGSYLATHWNTANSVWLDSGGAPPPPPPDPGDDTEKPDCKRAYGTRSKIYVPVQDTGSGLADLTATYKNLAVSYPDLSSSPTTTQTVVGKKINRSKRATIYVTATDSAGNSIDCVGWRF